MFKDEKKLQKKVHPTFLFGSNLLSSKCVGLYIIEKEKSILCTSLFHAAMFVHDPPSYTTDLFLLVILWCSLGGLDHMMVYIHLSLSVFLICFSLFVSCCYRTLTNYTHTHSLDLYRDGMMVMIFVFVFPSFPMSVLNEVDGCEKTKEKDQKNTVESWCNNYKNWFVSFFASARV